MRISPGAVKGLVLFDIDGTLLRRAGPHHRISLVDAIRRATGLETSLDHIPLQGMLDRDIVTRMLADAGATRRLIREAMPEIFKHAQNLYVRRCPDLRRKLCPGVRALLGKISRRGIPMGLVTGNLSRIGWRKVDRAGIRPHFQFGAFAEQGNTRAALVRLALRYARGNGLIDRNGPVTLIGDHRNDVQAAKANGIRAVAVATGQMPVDELIAAGADAAVPDLRELAWEDLFDS